MKKVILLFSGIICALIVLNLSFGSKLENGSVHIEVLMNAQNAMGEEPGTIQGKEDQWCRNGQVGCCGTSGTCETGILCGDGGC